MAYDGHKVIEIAQKEKGTREGPNDDNKYGRAFGVNNVLWCSQFVWWVMREAGFSVLYPKTASTRYSYDHYLDKGWTVPVSKVQPGDIVWFKNPSRPGRVNHIGFAIRGRGGGMVDTIEGNTTKEPGGPSAFVWTHTQSARIVAIGRPGGLDEDDRFPGRIIELGSTGPAVEYVQQHLNRFLPRDIDVDGEFGDITKAALQKWQANRRLPASGRVGPNTWYMLAAPRVSSSFRLVRGAQGERVKQLKRALNRFGNQLDVNNPNFGPTTEDVVKAWQRHRGQRVDGVVDFLTWFWIHAPKATASDVPDLHPDQ
jgi:peptidoglycan hydrolase-like protein with peptidoglycan-binding domain